MGNHNFYCLIVENHGEKWFKKRSNSSSKKKILINLDSTGFLFPFYFSAPKAGHRQEHDKNK